MSIELISADQYTIEELTAAYNQTRADYLVPMSMDAAKLREYISLYDLRLDKSLVAKEDGNIIGLAMLGVRPNCSWITRLGLVANLRGRGVGKALLEGLLRISDVDGIPKNMLEVILGNTSAHQLFIKSGFQDVRQLLILRRPAGQIPPPNSPARWLEADELGRILSQRTTPQAWTNQTKTLINATGITGFEITYKDGTGWIIFRESRRKLSHLVFATQNGDPVEMMHELLRHLHHRYPTLDTHTENIPTDDPHLPAFYQSGYAEVFRRIEMVRYPNLVE